MSIENPQKFLQLLFDQTWRAASPQNCMQGFVPDQPQGKTVVIGAGKASAEMARVLENLWLEKHGEKLSGIVLTRYGHGAETKNIQIIQAAHPVPDRAGLEGAQKIVDLIADLGADDLIICLVSGGGSALLTAPAAGITLAEKQDINKQLLRSGAPIDEMNCVRKHLSAIKGGRLAQAAFPAKIITLMISDVPGDDPSVVASGPTVADTSTRGKARQIIDKYQLDIPAHIRDYLADPQSETPKPGDRQLAHASNKIIAAPAMSLAAAQAYAMAQNLPVKNLGDDIEGESRKVALDHAKQAITGRPGLIISGGETTVTVKGNGAGGRNTEYALALAIALAGHNKIYAIACDTDGIDGVENNAGAIITPTTLVRAAKLGLSPQAFLDNNDAYGFFRQLGDLVITGPTRTNVNDFRAILIMP
jgi:hydroxypyruvate reductase